MRFPLQLLIALLLGVMACPGSGTADDNAPSQESLIKYETPAGRMSLGVFEKNSGRLVRTLRRGLPVAAGQSTSRWDGRDDNGRVVPEGDYEWRAVVSSGFTARYLMTVGVNPPGGEHPEPRRSWVGDHVGAGLVAVDGGAVFIGSPLTESLMSLVSCDAAMSRVEWRREQFYDGGALRALAAGGGKVFLLDPKGCLRRLDAKSGNVEATWQIADGDADPSDLDASGSNLLAAMPTRNAVRWLSTASGNVLAEVTLDGVSRVTAIGDAEKSDGLAVAGRSIFRVQPGAVPQKLESFDGEVTSIDYDPLRRETWVVVESHQVLRLDENWRVVQRYGGQRRSLGRFDPLRFAGVEDIATDGTGGFLIGEPGAPPRRVARFARDGRLVDQWFGGMAFYVSGAFDPDDATRLFGIAPEGAVHEYRLDLAAGKWTVAACYATGRLGDSLFPFTGPFRVVRRQGKTFLYHRLMPAVVRLDEARGEAVPVAVAGQPLNSGRNFFQFAGTGRDGWPQPWVAAAERQGFQDLNQVPKFYSWADSDGDGTFDSDEFRFYANASVPVSFGNVGDVGSEGDFLLAGGINPTQALVRVPVSGWEGPDKTAPRWDFGSVQAAGEIIADGMGWGSPRGLSVAPDGSVNVAWQAGLLVRDHGQYEGGGWPEQSVRGSRVLGFDAQSCPLFAAGRQTKDPREANSGMLFYPMQTEYGPDGTVVVNDQTRQPPQVWTKDGLYVGAFFDHRVDDGRDDGFYRTHGDDNQGIALASAGDGRVLWLAPGIGHNRLYEITGWNQWQRRQGDVRRPAVVTSAKPGQGLKGQYFSGDKMVFETTEAPLFYEPFGDEPHKDRITAPYRAVWSGYITAPLTDHYTFSALLGQGEQITVQLDGREVLVIGSERNIKESADLTANHPHALRIEYSNPSDRAELKLFVAATTLDPTKLQTEWLHEGPVEK